MLMKTYLEKGNFRRVFLINDRYIFREWILTGNRDFFSHAGMWKMGNVSGSLSLLSALGIEEQEACLTRLNHEIKLNNFRGEFRLTFEETKPK